MYFQIDPLHQIDDIEQQYLQYTGELKTLIKSSTMSNDDIHIFYIANSSKL